MRTATGPTTTGRRPPRVTTRARGRAARCAGSRCSSGARCTASGTASSWIRYGDSCAVGCAGLLLAFVAVFGVIFFHALAQHPTGAVIVRLIGGVKACLPLPLALLRTPVSLYVPALDLPVWAGITQLFFAFALAELALGRARTLVVAYAAAWPAPSRSA